MNSDGLIWFKSSYSQGDGGECVEVALSWRKSSYSGTAGGDCVEVACSWRKSSHSGTTAGDCVEVAAVSQAVHIRDSKRPQGPQLAVPAAAWAHFVAFTSVV
ncbi:DUF397 domain-containing protein [Streptomyces sp. XH2]|uniref:DUF397 domain-containing protein n=1 Tax=Streptomyces sp. XH2 TaxID=3412483 RepID=UPI003C7A955E